MVANNELKTTALQSSEVRTACDAIMSGRNDGKQQTSSSLSPGQVSLGGNVYSSREEVKEKLTFIRQQFQSSRGKDRQIIGDDANFLRDCMRYNPDVDCDSIAGFYFGPNTSFTYTMATKPKKAVDFSSNEREQSLRYLKFPVVLGDETYFNEEDILARCKTIKDERRCQGRLKDIETQFILDWIRHWKLVNAAAQKLQYAWYSRHHDCASREPPLQRHYPTLVQAISPRFYRCILYECAMPEGQKCMNKLKQKALIGKMGFVGPNNSVGIPRKVFHINLDNVAVVDQGDDERKQTRSIDEEFSRRNTLFVEFLETLDENKLSPADMDDLTKRGVGDPTDAFTVGLFSIEKNHNHVSSRLGKALPGLRGGSGKNSSVASGLFIPAYTPGKMVLGAQVKPTTGNVKYKWWGDSLKTLKENNSPKESHEFILRDTTDSGRVELPLFCFRNFEEPLENVRTVGLTEGALKPCLAYLLSRNQAFLEPSSNSMEYDDLSIPLLKIDAWIGAAGGAFEISRVLLAKYLSQFPNLTRIILFPDAGAISLDEKTASEWAVLHCVTQQLFVTKSILLSDCKFQEKDIAVAFWPQQNFKENMLDIDDLLHEGRGNEIRIRSWAWFEDIVTNLHGGPAGCTAEKICAHIRYIENNVMKARSNKQALTMKSAGKPITSTTLTLATKKPATVHPQPSAPTCMVELGDISFGSVYDIRKKRQNLIEKYQGKWKDNDVELDVDDEKFILDLLNYHPLSHEKKRGLKTIAFGTSANITGETFQEFLILYEDGNKDKFSANKCFGCLEALLHPKKSSSSQDSPGVTQVRSLPPPISAEDRNLSLTIGGITVTLKTVNELRNRHDRIVARCRAIWETTQGDVELEQDERTFYHELVSNHPLWNTKREGCEGFVFGAKGKMVEVFLKYGTEATGKQWDTFSIKKILKNIRRKLTPKTVSTGATSCSPNGSLTAAVTCQAVETDVAMVASEPETSGPRRMYKYTLKIEISGGGTPVSSRWFMVSKTPVADTAHPYLFRFTKTDFVSKNGGFLYEDSEEEEEEVDEMVVKKTMKATLLGDAVSILLDREHMKKLWMVDYILSRNGAKEKEEYMVPDIYSLEDDSVGLFLSSLDRFIDADILPVWSGKRVSDVVFNSILLNGPQKMDVRILKDARKTIEVKSINAVCFSKGKYKKVSYREHYASKGTLLTEEEQPFLTVSHFPESKNAKSDDIPAENLSYHKVLRRRDFEHVRWVKKWIKFVHAGQIGDESFQERLLLSDKEGFTFRLRDENLNREVNLHRSWAQEHRITYDNQVDIQSYERLEGLGDAVLDYCVFTLLIDTLPSNLLWRADNIRAMLVRNNVLAVVNRQWKMYDFLQKKNLPPRLTPGKDIPSERKLLADHVEAWIGGKFLDTGLVSAKQCVGHLFYSIPKADLEVVLSVDGGRKLNSKQLSQVIDEIKHKWSSDPFDRSNGPRVTEKDSYPLHVKKKWGALVTKFSVTHYAFLEKYSEKVADYGVIERAYSPGQIHLFTVMIRLFMRVSIANKDLDIPELYDYPSPMPTVPGKEKEMDKVDFSIEQFFVIVAEKCMLSLSEAYDFVLHHTVDSLFAKNSLGEMTPKMIEKEVQRLHDEIGLYQQSELNYTPNDVIRSRNFNCYNWDDAIHAPDDEMSEDGEIGAA